MCPPPHSKHPAHATANVKIMMDYDNILTFVLCVNAAIYTLAVMNTMLMKWLLFEVLQNNENVASYYGLKKKIQKNIKSTLKCLIGPKEWNQNVGLPCAAEKITAKPQTAGMMIWMMPFSIFIVWGRNKELDQSK